MEPNTPLYTPAVALPVDPAIVESKPIDISTPAPVSKADRLQSIDMIRGVALLGILLMNIPGFGIDWSQVREALVGPQNTTDFRTLAVIETFFAGTMRGLFSMLFGAGMVLFTINKKDTPGGVTVAEYYYRRLLWLVLFGVINAYVFLWPGDILYFYGLCGMVLFPFRKISAKWLIVLGIVCMAIGLFKNLWGYTEFRGKRIAYIEAITAEKANQKLTEKQEAAKAEWLAIEKNQKPDPERTTENITNMRSGYGTVFTWLMPNNSGSETWGMYHGLWDMLSMMLIGMGLFLGGFFSNTFKKSNYAMGVILGYGIGIPLGWIVFKEGWVGSQNIGTYLDTYRVPHWALYDLRRVLLTVGHASLLMLFFRSSFIPWFKKGLANVGQMAFTNYLMQSIFCTLIFYGYGLGNYNKLQYHQLYYVVAGIWVFQIIFSAIWLRYFRFGPFEWLWRSVTYWKKQPMQLKKIES
jgi:uncharacterized protein